MNTDIYSTLFYLLGIMVNTTLWKLAPFLQHSSTTLYVIVGVAIIETLRPYYYRMYVKFQSSFEIISTNKVLLPLNELLAAVASGFGWGVLHVLMYYSTIVLKSAGPGTYFVGSCDSMSVISVASLMAPLVFVIHVCLMIIFFNALSNPVKNRAQWWIAFFVHMLSSLWVCVYCTLFKYGMRVNVSLYVVCVCVCVSENTQAQV